VATPLLLQLFSANKDQLLPERKELCIKALESYLVRRMICRMTTKDYNRLVLELIPKVNENIQTADEVIIKHLKDQTTESRIWPGDEQVEKAVLDLPLYRLLTRGRLRFVLEALEEANRTGKAEEAHTPRGSLTIEHILPQSWQENWPINDVDDPEEYLKRVSERERIKHSIGNLTLITNKLNPSLSNGPWNKKKQGLQDHSTLFLNKVLLGRWGDTSFGEAEIKERGHELAQLICSIWPI
jgi:transcription termination factor NusB